MAEQPKDQQKKRPTIRTRATAEAPPAEPTEAAPASPTPESAAANAALALAVMSARKAADGKDTSAPASPAPASAGSRIRLPAGLPASLRAHAAQAALVALALGLGFVAGSRGSAPAAAPAWAEATQALMRQNQDDVVRLSGDVRTLKVAVDAARESVDKARDAGRGGVPAERLDRSERLIQDASARLGRLAEQLDRMEKAERDPARFAALVERLDRLERQGAILTAQASRPAVVQAAAEPVQTASLQPAAPPAAAPQAQPPQAAASPAPAPDAKELKSQEAKGPDPRTIPLEGWVLREVYDGVALIEGRNKRLVEVAPGQNLPGAGRIEAIERRGKAWFVITQKGFIGMDRWW